MLQPTPYPEHLPSPKKLSVLEKQAEALGQKHNFYRVPQTTFFREGLNNAGVQMKASTCSGQDCTGVNDGSKNSVLMNYIPDAWNWGAEMFCECEVRYISREPKGNGYIIFFAWHGAGREKFEDNFHRSLMWVRAVSIDHLFILPESALNFHAEGTLLPWGRFSGNNRDSPPFQRSWFAGISYGRAKALWKRGYSIFW